MNAAEKKTIVGCIHYAMPKETVEFDDSKRYLEELKEALDTYGVMGGFRYETLTDDPKTRKAVDDLLYDAVGEENPRKLEDYAARRPQLEPDRLDAAAKRLCEEAAAQPPEIEQEPEV